ncbi:class II fructose-bisphosphate aldolase [Metabacillus arenae]|uniref:Class II fructose-bisphosphate aldolase n=1 Tax=Metabacillus arenae TaxID=2771434 RepID=A0A926NJL5_9BACI|nr:class II fructose-bisphosphate aldolase [Metabacillus arenae]MBD1381975.1 class II fructose-bisphosphate aldolase [Metabacillus arenae]
MYTDLKALVDTAKKGGYAVGSFNLHCMEMLPAMIAAAEKAQSPIIIQISTGTANYISMPLIVSMVRTLAEKSSVPVALHLDHTTDYEEIKKAIDAGFTSVMVDGSHLPIEENIELTKKVVAYAHPRNVSVEAELGTIGGTEEGVTVTSEEIMYTSPDEAKYFVDETGVDALAVAIGTAHGQYKSKAKLNFEILEAIHKKVDLPLVLHGGTGVAYSDLERCISGGIAKVNVGTEINIGWIETAKQEFEKSKITNSLRNVLIPCNQKVEDIVYEKIIQLKSADKVR